MNEFEITIDQTMGELFGDFEPPKRIQCATCKNKILEDYVINKGTYFECYDCDDPDWMRDLPTLESRGAI